METEKRKPMKNEKGFTFIEVVIALGVLGVIAVGFLSGLGTASKTLSIADERQTANNLAEAQVEYVKRQAYDTDASKPPDYKLLLNIPDHYSIDQPLAEWLDPKLDGLDNDDGIQKIKVTVRHDGKEVLTLEDYKVR
jgi:prepilin-type N-terminal cleavage/methylation domain-containing protein